MSISSLKFFIKEAIVISDIKKENCCNKREPVHVKRKKKMSVAMKSVRTDRFGHNQYLTRKSIFDSQIFDGSATSPFRGILRLVLLASFFYALNNFFVPNIISLISLHRTDTSTRATSRLTGYSLELCLLRFLSASSIG